MVKISTNIKNFIETITKKLFYTKTETDTKLNNKANKTTATTSANGLMSKEDKSKLDGIATEANKTVVDSSLSSSSTNPVQNKVVNSALNGKSNTGHEHTSDEIHYAYDQNVSVTTILENKAAKNHTHDDRYYTETEMDTKLDNKANSTHTHNISDVTGLSTSLDGKMSNDYSESIIESNFFAHKIGNIVIVTWWGGTLPTAQNSWVDWKTLPYKSCNTQPIWVNGDGIGCEARVRVPPNSNKLQIFISGGTGSIRPGMIVYPTK